MTTVFLSYRHETDVHCERVLHFCRALQTRGAAAGLRIILDQVANLEEFNRGGPPHGWTRWSVQQATEAEKVLIIGSPGWFRAFERKEVPATGLGAAAEARVIEERIYQSTSGNNDIRIVFLDEADVVEVPIYLNSFEKFRADRDLQQIVCWLTGGGAAPSTAPAPRPPTNWPVDPPVVDWSVANRHSVRDALARLLTEGSPHRVLLLQGPAGIGKSTVTRHLLGWAELCVWLVCGTFDFKGFTSLEGEFSRFVPRLRVDQAVEASAGEPLVDRLNAVLDALKKIARPTLLIFDTFEQAADGALWLEDTVLPLAASAPWLRIVIAGQTVPMPALSSPWAEVTGPVISLKKLTWRDWFDYGVQHRPDLTETLVRQCYTLAGGEHGLLCQLLGPAT